jgi:hypothetical protein
MRRPRKTLSLLPKNRVAAIASVLLCWCWTLAPTASAGAAEPTAPALRTKLVSISLFKNGLGFVAREGEIPRGQGVSLIGDLPAPAHGTFWVYSVNDEATVKDVVAFESEAVERVEAISVAEMIEANVGEIVDVRLSDKETIRAKIISAAANRTADPSALDPSRSPYAYYGAPAEGSSLVLLQVSGRTMALNKNAVQQLSSAEGPLKTTIERKKRTVRLRLSAANPGGKGRVVVQYLAKGITWAPSCAIEITDAKKARVTTKAEIIDEIEDLDNVSVNLVTGFPNLKFADVTDPMAMRGNLAAFLNNLANPAQGADYRGRGDVVMRQSVMENSRIGDEEMFPAYASGPQEGQTREELFFYEQRNVTLKKGERGYYPLFTTEVPYEHLYEWKIGDAIDDQEQYRNRDEGGSEKVEDVWHSIRLTNTSSVPWTTAPALTMQGGKILGQDLIHYTSPGGKTTVRITKSVDVNAEQAEYEVARTRNAANFYGYSYDLVEVRGKLKATNFKDKDITLTITKKLSGEVVKSVPAAKIEQTARGLKKVNPKSVLTWELPIKSRDKTEIDYSYKVYVRD